MNPSPFTQTLRPPFVLTTALSGALDIDLSGRKVAAAMQSSQAASLLLQTYTNTLAETPLISLPPNVDTLSMSTVVEDLPQHQMTAQTHALSYLTNINPLVSSTVADVIGFANLWTAQFPLLVQLANDIDEGNNRETFMIGINNLIRQAQVARACVGPVRMALDNFLSLVQTDNSNLSGDLSKVKTALEGDTGEIDQLAMQVTTLRTKIKNAIAAIATAATEEFLAVGTLIVAVVTTVTAGGVPFVVFVVAVAGVAQASGAIVLASLKLDEAKRLLVSTLATLNHDKAVFTQTMMAAGSLQNLLDAVDSGMTAVKDLETAWKDLALDFQRVVDIVQVAAPGEGPKLVERLEAANIVWQATLRLAINLQMRGTLPVQMSMSTS